MRILLTLVCAIAFAACGSATPSYNITPTNPGDTIIYEWANDTATFDITSPGGIGGARFVRAYGKMPKRILLRLRLKGLESLKLRFENHEVQVAVSYTQKASIHQTARLDGGDEIELAPDNPYRIPTEIVSVSETIPLVDGYFRVELPRAFYETDAREFSVEWIDFFR